MHDNPGMTKEPMINGAEVFSPGRGALKLANDLHTGVHRAVNGGT